MDKTQRKFLKEFAHHGVAQKALDYAKAPRSHLRKWMDDEKFVEAYQDAQDAANDAAELELRERAMGYYDILLHKGEPVWKRDPQTGDILLDDDFNPIPYTVKKRSDRLLEVYAKAKLPAFKEKSTVELEGRLNTNIEVSYVLPEGKTYEDYEKKD